jgi:transcription initiation factor TFIIE subunit beta
MALNERLSKFKQQQERCQTTLSSIAATQASTAKLHISSRSKPVNAPAAPAKQIPAVKFSNDTERLQHINSIRKSPVGAQIKLVIELLYKVICQEFNLMSLPVFHGFFLLLL